MCVLDGGRQAKKKNNTRRLYQVAVVRRKPSLDGKGSEGPDKKHFISTNGMQFVQRIRRWNGTCKNYIQGDNNNNKKDVEQL